MSFSGVRDSWSLQWVPVVLSVLHLEYVMDTLTLRSILRCGMYYQILSIGTHIVCDFKTFIYVLSCESILKVNWKEIKEKLEKKRQS